MEFTPPPSEAVPATPPLFRRSATTVEADTVADVVYEVRVEGQAPKLALPPQVSIQGPAAPPTLVGIRVSASRLRLQTEPLIQGDALTVLTRKPWLKRLKARLQKGPTPPMKPGAPSVVQLTRLTITAPRPGVGPHDADTSVGAAEDLVGREGPTPSSAQGVNA